MKSLRANPPPPLPVLRRIVSTPVFTADGHLHATAGYDPKSQAFYAPDEQLRGATFRTEAPTQPEIDAARDLLCTELIGDFPFANENEKAHALALLLLPFVRGLVDGPTPLHLIEKPSPGSGASLMVDALLFPALGHSAEKIPPPRSDDEMRKVVVSKLRPSPPAIVLDNWPTGKELDSAALAAAVTARVFESRQLGVSHMLALPVDCAWVITANNPTLSLELMRRTVRVRLDPRTERAWQRRNDWRHPNLLGWAKEHRVDLIQAALTLTLGWLDAGRPLDTPRLGMFESWSEVLGGILLVAGVPGFLRNLEDAYRGLANDDADPLVKMQPIVAHWWVTGGSPKTAGDIISLATDGALPLEGLGGSNISFGQTLRALRDRTFTVDGTTRVVLTLSEGRRDNANLWELRREQ